MMYEADTLEIMRRIRKIELHTRRLVRDKLAGSYHTAFKGQGLMFDSVRHYMPGDDVRRIDWNVTARTNEPVIKRFNEERELTVLLLVDVSASVMFGSGDRRKRDVLAELGAALAFSAMSNNDNVGMILFSDKVECLIPPRKGRNHALRLIRELVVTKPNQQGTDIALALRTANHLLKRHAIVFLLTDFMADAESYLRELQYTCQRHDVIGVAIVDQLEQSWGKLGIIGLVDAESNQHIWSDTSDEQWQKALYQQVNRQQRQREKTLRQAQLDMIEVRNDGDYLHSLSTFFQQRSQRTRS